MSTHSHFPFRRFVFICAIATVCACAAAAQGGSAPEQIAKVDGVFAKYNRTDSPGCAVSVMKDGGIIYKHGYGMANLDYDETIKPSTVFHVASMSKQFVAASIVLLAQQGKLSLDDDVRKYIPELPDFGETITVKHLIFHTSGLRDQWELLELAGWRYSLDLITDDDVMSLVTRQKELNFKPGDKHVYCNTGYTLLAQIVKRVSGMSLREFTTKNIFEPLGMKSTHFRDDHAEIIKGNAYGYQREGATGPFRLSVTNFDTVGATSLHTTVEDLALWDENFYNPRVGGPALIRQMMERGKLNNGETLDYAFGIEHGNYRGLPTIDHGGADAGYRSDLVRFPDQHFSVATLCNFADTNPSGLTRQVADIYLADQMKPATQAASGSGSGASATIAPPTEQQMSAIAGTYWDRDGDDYLKVIAKDGKLSIDTGNQVFALKPAGENFFHLDGVSFGDSVNLRFVAASGDKPKELQQSFLDGKPSIFEGVASYTPASAELANYAGSYVSAEIDPVYRIKLMDGKLLLTRLKHGPTTLSPRAQDVFTCDLGTVRFTRDAKKQVSGFLLNTGRVRNFKFTKRAE